MLTFGAVGTATRGKATTTGVALTPRRRAPCRSGKAAAPTPWRSRAPVPGARAGEVLLGAREIAMGKRGPRGRRWCRRVGRAVLQVREAQEACEWIVRPWDRRDGSAVRDEDRGRFDHLLHLQQQCLGLRTNLRFATIDRSPVPTDRAQADRGRFHRKCGAGLAERLKRNALAPSFVRRS